MAPNIPTATQRLIYDQMLNVWPGRLTATSISHGVKRHPSTVRRNLWILEAHGHVAKTRIHGEHYWVLTNRGEKHARADLAARERARRELERLATHQVSS